MSPPAIPFPPNEAGRLAALRDYGILDSPPEQAFDDLARLAAETCGVPVALISFVDAERVWLKARLGVTTTEASTRLGKICEMFSRSTTTGLPVLSATSMLTWPS